MERKWRIGTVICLLALTLVTAPSAMAVIISDDMETTAGWYSVAGAVLSADPYAAVDGNAIRVTTTASWGAAIRSPWPLVEVGKTYRATVTVRTADPAYLSIFGMPGEIGEVTSYAAVSWSSGHQKLSVYYTVPNGVTSLYIGLYVYGGAGKEDSWWDNFELVELADVDECPSTPCPDCPPDLSEELAAANAQIATLQTALDNCEISLADETARADAAEGCSNSLTTSAQVLGLTVKDCNVQGTNAYIAPGQIRAQSGLENNKNAVKVVVP